MSHSIASSSISDEIACIAFEDIWESTSSAITAKWIGTLEVPLATALSIFKLKKIVPWSIMCHDGEVSIRNDKGEYNELEKVEPDGEPSPPHIDPWARGTVQTRVAAPGDTYVQNAGTAPPSTGGSSFKSSIRGSSRTQSAPAGSRVGTGHKKHDEEVGQIIELDDPEADFANLENSHAFTQFQKLKLSKNS